MADLSKSMTALAWNFDGDTLLEMLRGWFSSPRFWRLLMNSYLSKPTVLGEEFIPNVGVSPRPSLFIMDWLRASFENRSLFMLYNSP
jgi:hypothetical protein